MSTGHNETHHRSTNATQDGVRTKHHTRWALTYVRGAHRRSLADSIATGVQPPLLHRPCAAQAQFKSNACVLHVSPADTLA